MFLMPTGNTLTVTPVTASYTDNEMYSNGGGKTTSITKTCAIGTAAANRHILVGCGTSDTGNPTHSVTIGGNTMTQIIYKAQTASNKVGVSFHLYAFPTGTTSEIIFTASGDGDFGLGFAVIAMYGANPTATQTESASNNTTSTNTVSISCDAGGLIIGYNGSSGDATTTTAWTNLTERAEVNNIATWFGMQSLAFDQFESGASSRSVSSAITSAGNGSAMVVAAFAPA